MNLMVRYINENWTHGEAAGNFWGDTPFPTLSSDWNSQPEFRHQNDEQISSSMVNEFQFSRAGNDIFVTTNPAGDALNQQIAAPSPQFFPRVEGTGFPTVGWGDEATETCGIRRRGLITRTSLSGRTTSQVFGSHHTKFGVLVSHTHQERAPNGGSGLYTISQSGARTGNPSCGCFACSSGLPLVESTEFERSGHYAGPLARLRILRNRHLEDAS